MSHLNANRPMIVGEVLFDCFGDDRKLGGAPFNVAWNLQGLNTAPRFVSAVGDDEDGRTVITAMRSWGMDTSGVCVLSQLPTGTVDVTLKNNEPSYDIRQGVAYDAIEIDDSSNLTADCALFYHGSLALRSRVTRESIFNLTKNLTATRFLDINVRQPYFDPSWLPALLGGVHHLKLNEYELRYLSQLGGNNANSTEITDLVAYARYLKEQFSIGQFWVTLGERGSLWIGPHLETEFAATSTVEAFVDTVGAGDAFAAVVIRSILQGDSPEQTLRSGNRLAAKVCGIRGAICRDPYFYRVDVS